MLVAHFIGDHREDSLGSRLGWALTRLAQKGAFDRVTHCEAILQQHGPGEATIASATLRPENNGRNGVRTKIATLNPNHWLITDVPSFNVTRAREWFALHDGEEYDTRGALATVLPGRGQDFRWFCNEAVGASVGLRTPDLFTPAQFAAVCMTFGVDVTERFFS